MITPLSPGTTVVTVTTEEKGYSADCNIVVEEGMGLLWPVPGYYHITAPFGYRVHPITGQPGSFHGGIDIAAPRGTPIRAAADGVAYPYYGASYGYYVIIIHGSGMSTLYAHNSSNAVSSGQQVQRGETIAYVGSTGAATGPHVHYITFED